MPGDLRERPARMLPGDAEVVYGYLDAGPAWRLAWAVVVLRELREPVWA